VHVFVVFHGGATTDVLVNGGGYFCLPLSDGYIARYLLL
jgi:hypothetical protein